MNIQSNLVISNSLISNYRLSRIENLVPVLTWNYDNRQQNNVVLFSTLLYIFLTSGVKLHIHLLNVIVQFVVFLTLSTLICRGTDISKYFSETLGIRDSESRLYLIFENILRTCSFEKGFCIGPWQKFAKLITLHKANKQTHARTYTHIHWDVLKAE